MQSWKIKPHTFKFREGDSDEKGGCTFIGGTWKDVTTDELFAGKKVVLFSLPGAFTPTCSSEQLPAYEEMYDKFKHAQVDEVYCVSVNDAFVMNAWARDLGIKKVKMIPDGCGTFTSNMGMLVSKPAQGFGMRSWRYSALVEDGLVTRFNQEPGYNHQSADADPYTRSDPQTILATISH